MRRLKRAIAVVQHDERAGEGGYRQTGLVPTFERDCGDSVKRKRMAYRVGTGGAEGSVAFAKEHRDRSVDEIGGR